MARAAKEARSLSKLQRLSGRDAIPGMLVVLGLALFATDDVHMLRGYGGGLLASPGWIPILLSAALIARRTVSTSDRHALATTAAVWLYGVGLTFVTMFFVPSELLGQSTIGKSLKLAFTIAVLLSMVIAGGILTRRLRKWVFIGASVALAIMVVSALLGHLGVMVIDNWGAIHSSQNVQMRVRGTRIEPSSLGGGILTMGSLAAITARRSWGPFYLAVVCVVGVLVAESRGTMVVSIVGLIVTLVWFFASRAAPRISKPWLYSIAAVITAAVIVSTLGMDLLLSSPLWKQIGLANSGGSTSDATRAVFASVSRDTLAQYPLGMGYGAYLQWFPKLLDHASSQLSGAFPPEAFSELRSITGSANDSTLSAKNLPSVAISYLGWVGLAATATLYFVAIKSGSRQGGGSNRAAFPAVLIVVLVSATYFWSVFSSDQMFFFGAAILGLLRGARSDDYFDQGLSERFTGAGGMRNVKPSR